MAMDNSFNKLADVVSGRDAWKFLVRVVRMLEVPDQVSSVELVLVDECGEPLQAALSEAADKLALAEQDKEKLLKENASLSSTVRKLSRDVSKLEVFRKALMQSLQEDEEKPASCY